MNKYSTGEIDKIYKACQLAAQALSTLYDKIRPGISTLEINNMLEEFVTERGGKCACIGYKGFPKACCTSINNVVCHGIPSENTILKDGDIINVDIVVLMDGYHGDTSRMFYVGTPSIKAKNLVETTYNAMMAGINAIEIGKPVRVIGEAIEEYINNSFIKYSIVENYCGHGLGKKMHEEPHIFHYSHSSYDGPIISEGMCFTIEPMINAGKKKVRTLGDDWTVVTSDRDLSAQWEHAIAITKDGYKILTIDENYRKPV